jgi:hypothetical protein
MEGLLKVHVEFLDGRPAQDEEMPANYPPGKEKEACMQLLAAINMTGGIMHFEPDGITLLPLNTIKSLKITAPSVVIGSAADLPPKKLVL